MIATRTEIKALMNLTGTASDDLIDSLMPEVNGDILGYCKHGCYVKTGIEYTASTIAFTATTITDSASQFVEEGFTDQSDILVCGSDSNDEIYTPSTVATGIITVDTSEELFIEAVGNSITITQIRYNRGLKLAFAQMVNSKMDVNVISGITEYSLADYAIKYGSANSTYIGGYPDTITSSLTRHKAL